MKILSITTSSQICGVAILEDCTLIKEINLNNGLTHSETLMPLIKEILNETKLELKDIDLLVSDIGPGSFTGIRIGVSTIKAFADSLNIKSIGVTSLEALNYNFSDSGICVSLIDAKKDNVYSQIFENSENNRLIRRNVSFENIDNLLLELRHINPDYNIAFVGTGSQNYKEKILSYFPNSLFLPDNDLSAKNVGVAGFTNFKSGNILDNEPLYVRKSEAEQKLEEKLSIKN